MFIELRGRALHVTVDGPPGAPALLLIHSLGSSLHIWDAQAAALSRGLRVVRIDLPGHGLSEPGADSDTSPVTIGSFADDALGVLDALGIATAHVGGISLGGLVAQAVAARARDRVRSLILVGTAMAIPPPETWRARAAAVRAGGLAAVADASLARWVSPAYLASPAGRGLRQLMLRTTVEGYAAAAEALAVADLSATTPTIDAPTLVIVGEHDPSTPVALSEALCDAIRGARLVVLPGAHHVPTLDHADAVTAELRAFLTPDAALAGPRVRAEVLGAAHVARAAAAATALDRDFQAFITHSAWGGVWARPHFDYRTRSIITLAILAALGRDHELALHIRAMRNTGATADDLSELLMHVAVYAGVPAANTAIQIARSILEAHA